MMYGKTRQNGTKGSFRMRIDHAKTAEIGGFSLKTVSQ